jgi:hypothetical protein
MHTIRFEENVAKVLRDLASDRHVQKLYIEKEGRGLTKCLLCNVGGQSRMEMANHCNDERHERNVSHLKNSIRKFSMLSSCAKHMFDCDIRGLNAMLDTVSHTAWKDSVRAEFFQYFIAPGTDDEKEDRNMLLPVVTKLFICLLNEWTTLLGLAVWKAKCHLQAPLGLDLLATHEWLRSGWKMCKSEQRASQDMDVIVSLVRPFLM